MRAKVAGKKQTDIDNDRKKLSTENRRQLKYFGEAEVDFPPEQIGERVATLGDHFESYLESEWTEWITSCAEVEAAAGIQLKKNQYAYRTATLEVKGTVPGIFTQILMKALGE